MSNEQKPIEMITLSSGRHVSKRVHDEVLRLAQDYLPYMLPGRRFSTETICGNDLWDRPITMIRIWAGQCMAHFERTGVLPIKLADVGKRKTKMYEIL